MKLGMGGCIDETKTPLESAHYDGEKRKTQPIIKMKRRVDSNAPAQKKETLDLGTHDKKFLR